MSAMQKTIVLAACIVAVCLSFSEASPVAVNSNSSPLSAQEMKCFKDVTGATLTSNAETATYWQNEVTGLQLTKCIFHESGAVGADGVFDATKGQEVFDGAITVDVSARTALKSNVVKCSETVAKTDVDGIIRCIYTENKKLEF